MRSGLTALTVLVVLTVCGQLLAADAVGGQQGQNAWWSSRQAGLYGGLAGSVAGLLGGLVGTLVGFGRARRLVLTIFGLGIAASAVAVVAGVTALIFGQPYHVYYPLLLCGGIFLILFPSLLPVMLARYRALEVRKMEAMDMG